MTTCQYDSGSATDCQPICDRPAEFTVTYHGGSYGPFRVQVCKRHVSPMEGRAYPGHDSTERIVR